MIRNKPARSDDRIDLNRSAIEHRATWFALLIDEAVKNGLDPEFARDAIFRCGSFHGQNKYPATDDLKEFSAAFANPDAAGTFEMEILRNDGQHLDIDFHYCPLLAAFEKLGIPEADFPLLCDIAMDGDRGILSEYDRFSLSLGARISEGADRCELRIEKAEE